MAKVVGRKLFGSLLAEAMTSPTDTALALMSMHVPLDAFKVSQGLVATPVNLPALKLGI